MNMFSLTATADTPKAIRGELGAPVDGLVELNARTS
eukprot:COSAG02_NODE_23482_length_717_cov_1.302589_1_plen_35_part_10